MKAGVKNYFEDFEVSSYGIVDVSLETGITVCE